MEKIAVVGMSCLFPEARTPEEFWHNLMEQRDSRSLVTDDKMRLRVSDYYDPRKGKRGDRFYCMYGGYVRDFEMDPTGFQIPAESVQAMDDIYQWPLYVAREALKDSGYWGRSDVLARCGVIIGNLSLPTKSSNYLFLPLYSQTVEACLQQLLDNKDLRLPPFISSSYISKDSPRISGYPAAVVAQALSLSGPYFSLDAACASSLYSVKLSCDYLLTRKADMMLAGAVNAADPLSIHIGFSVLQAYPEEPSGSFPLDKNSGGLIAGEGAGMFVLKRYDDAVRDGDQIHAIILGTGLSNDGRGASVLSPNTKGQIAAFERAYAQAEVHPKTIQFVECHATGTVLGDKVELNSMDTFFGKHGASPLVGSVKSNLGHLLTAAGMPSMTKVILSMEKGSIPATIKVKDPQSSINKVIDTHQIPRSSVPWPKDQAVKRAAVSAFGLGGTNAHLIFEEDNPEAREAAKRSVPQNQQSPKKLSPMAIVGMDALFGPCRGLSAFHRSTYNGTQHFSPLPRERWKGIEGQSLLLRSSGLEEGEAPSGAYVDRFDLDFFRSKIPPNEDDRLIPQQLLALKVADNALLEAKVKPGDNVAVIVAMETELEIHRMRGRGNVSLQLKQSLAENAKALSPEQKSELETIVMDSVNNAAQPNQYTSFIGNIMTSRIASLWDFSGPAFTVSSEENSVFKALEVAQMMLDSGEIEAALVGAVDLAGGVESVLWRNSINKINTGERTFGFDQKTNGWMVGEGAGAVVLKRLDIAKRDGDRIYATIDAIGLAKGVSPDSVAEVCQQVFDKASVQPGDIGYLEVSGSGLKDEDEAEMLGLLRAYAKAGSDPRCAIGSVKANIGHTFAASGMASLIKTALCLYHRYLPGNPGWSAPKLAERWVEVPFYMPTESKTWFQEDQKQKRIAAISGVGQDGTCAHVILSEYLQDRQSPPSSYLAETPPYLFTVSGGGRDALQERLNLLKQDILAGASLSLAARGCFEACDKDKKAAYGLSIVGSDAQEILQEIDAALAALEKVFATGEDWVSLRGSYFTPHPLSKKGKIAFVYPGGLNSYVGLGRDFFQLLPEMYDEACSYSSKLAQMIGDKLLYPRSLRRLAQKDLSTCEKALFDAPITMFESGILFAILYTKMLRDLFRVQPQMALGHSMGEVSMWYALGACRKTDQMSDTLRSSPLFTTRLAGPMETLREAWNLPRAAKENEKIWFAYCVRTSPSKVREALKGESRAYLLFINSPKEAIIAGDDQACKRVIDRLGCESFEVPMNDVIHCEVAGRDYDELKRVHYLPISQVPAGIDFYSAHTFAPLPVDAESVSNNIATIYSHEVDFERLIRQAYDDGARLFLELGPRENCTGWITDILADKEHLAVAVNRKGADDKTSIVRALAKLHSHRINLDLSSLYPTPRIETTPQRSLIKTTTLGGVRIDSAILKEENIKRFRPSKAVSQPMAREDIIPLTPRLGKGDSQAVRKVAEPAIASQDIGRGQTSPKQAEKQEPSVKLPDIDLIPPSVQQFDENLALLSSAHLAFLQERREGLKLIAEMLQLQMSLAEKGVVSTSAATSLPSAVPEKTKAIIPPLPKTKPEPEGSLTWEELLRRYPPREKGPENRIKPAGEIFDYWDLREFAEGDISKVFGEKFKIVDSYKRKVRIPMEPYLLVSRITQLDAQTGVFKPCSMTTEYDIPYNAWYSIEGQIPWAVAVESGQCDLWLISYLGIDFECKSNRVYRLLDCTLTFLEGTPHEGDTLRYNIRINSFARTAGPLLFFFEYDCYVKDQQIIEMRGGCAGFFTDEELDAGKGIIRTVQEIEEKRKIEKKYFAPLLTCGKNSFDRKDLVELAHDNDVACFGSNYDRGGRNPSVHLSAEPMLMLDRVVSVDRKGGAWGLGLIVAEKDLAPNHWYFPCHFKDDEVLAGSLMAEGCGQLLRFYMLHLGLQTCTKNALFKPFPRLAQKVRCRGQVTQKDSLLTYRMEIKEIGTDPQPYAIADVDLLLGDKVVVDFQNLGMWLVEKDSQELPPQSVQAQEKPAAEDRDKGALFTKYHLQQFATGSIAKCFGPEFSYYDADNRRAPRTPNGDLQLVSRVLETTGERMDFKHPASVVTEYDVPQDIWFCRQNSHPAVIPYSMLMEISLQPNGFVSAWVGTTLAALEEDFCFRNLDGEGVILRDIDLRGKTITNHSELLSTVTMGTTILQQFRFELSHEGVPFFKGTTGFGYFLPEALVNQIGMDRGAHNNPLKTREYLPGPDGHIDLTSAATREQYYQKKAGKPYYHLAGPQLDFLDEVHIVEQGGKYQQGYICGYKKIDPTDWFYPCHFYQDPVMPGSLGIESILQAMQVFALQQDLGAQFKSPRFTQALNHRIVWKYRGQLIPTDDQMVIEVHIKNVERMPDQVTVIGDANLWKNDIRIYAITDAAICLQET